MQKNVCAVGCEAGLLDETLKNLSAEGWAIRQVYQESPSYHRQLYQELPAPAYYRVFAQREIPIPSEAASDRQGRYVLGPKSNADGREDEALQVIRDNPTLSQHKIVAKLRAMGIQRSMSWVGNKRFDMSHAAKA
jgi:hypothetical protein